MHSCSEFPWHRDRFGIITAARKHSSQALAIDFFATVASLRSKNAIVDAWATRWNLPTGSSWQLQPERLMPKDLLGEPRSTQVDMSAESDTALILFECKFTEADGGSCSQVEPLGRGSHQGQIQCDGKYSLQTNPVNQIPARCALTGKGILYWDWIPSVLNVDANSDHDPCPFRGGSFQWMRNLVACAALARAERKAGAVVITYADGPFPMATKIRSAEWGKFADLARDRSISLHTASYQTLLDSARAVAEGEDADTLLLLRDWIDEKVSAVSTMMRGSH